MSRALPFWKLEGAGNDFIGLDGRRGRLGLNRGKIGRMCDRRRGVGADGVLVLEKAKGRAADFRMRYYNADGGEAQMCGNGARCFAFLAKAVKAGRGRTLRVETGAGLVVLEILGKDVRVTMMEPGQPSLGRKIVAAGRKVILDCMNTGVPHAVEFVRSLASVDVARVGRAIRVHAAFAPAGTNVNFVEIGKGGQIGVRTFERGVEGETLACGTGVVAASILASLRAGIRPPIRVKTRGGDLLKVNFQLVGGRAKKITLQGPARIVYVGVVHV